MHTLETSELDKSHHNDPTVIHKELFAVRSFTVLVSSIQRCVAASFFVAIITAGTWSIQHQLIGFAVLLLSVILCTAIRIHRSEMNSVSAANRKITKSIDGDGSRRLLRQTGITLLVLMGITVISGWMFTLDLFWGLLWIEDVHALATYTAAGLLVLYCALALYIKNKSNYS